MDKNLDDTIESAMDAFWAVVATHHPECKTGDLAPDEYIRFYDECQLVIEQWIINNQGTQK